MNDNAEVIQGLREVADWLEAHPELPKAWFSMVNFDYTVDDPRAPLEQLAVALGDLAVEKATGTDMAIEGAFVGNVRVQCRVPIAKLADEPVPPSYEPIIGVPVDA